MGTLTFAGLWAPSSIFMYHLKHACLHSARPDLSADERCGAEDQEGARRSAHSGV